MILWPKSLYPTTLLGRGLRLGTLFVEFIRRRFSGEPDPVRIFVEIPPEVATAIAAPHGTSLTLESEGNIILTAREAVAVGEVQGVSAFLTSGEGPNPLLTVSPGTHSVTIQAESAQVTLQ